PAVPICLDEREGKREERPCRRRKSEEIEAPIRRCVARLGHEQPGGGEPDDADRDVDVEDPVPVDRFDQRPADEWAERETDSGDADPDPDRGRALTRME